MKTRYYHLIISFLLLTTVVDAQQVVVGTGTLQSLFSPISRIRDYSVYEIIYYASDINVSGNLTHFAFERSDGDSTNPIQDVTLYFKLTSDSSLASTNYSDVGYQQVYHGTWPNDAGAGWREVVLTTPFVYDNISNLQVLVVKGYEPSLSGNPVAVRWLYNNATGTPIHARRYTGADPITTNTSLTTINFYANARLTFGSVGIVEIMNSSVRVYPNPASGQLNIEFKSDEIMNGLTFQIHDITGKLCYSEIFEESAFVNIENLSAGIYYCSIQTENRSWVQKLLIQ
ncbi:MAG: T9SS type A sorting domain-containing protein [Bacteroidetes bacterium]|nr:MAG: T9SS type A sorting domain-containing protein [Bacteroidota bacterium]